jgi:hypothetical protein
MPRQVILKEKKKSEMQPVSPEQDQSSTVVENAMKAEISAEVNGS